MLRRHSTRTRAHAPHHAVQQKLLACTEQLARKRSSRASARTGLRDVCGAALYMQRVVNPNV
eukprot:679946-Pleurochrysis_carterae.AAC.2